MEKNEDVFGDPRFTSADLLPSREESRTLAPVHAIALWAVLAINPVSVELAAGSSGVVPSTLIPVVSSAVFLAMLGSILLRTPTRYGTGFAATARAAYGVHGTRWVLVARWFATVLWAAAWLGHLSFWAARFCRALADRFLVLPWGEYSGPATQGIAVGIAAVVVLLALRISRQTIEQFAARTLRRLIVAVALACSLTGLALWQVSEIVVSSAPTLSADLVRQSGVIVLATLPALLACAEWARRRQRSGIDPTTGRRRRRFSHWLSPFALVPIVLLFAGLSALLHHAGVLVSKSAAQGLVVSATAAAGALGGVLAILLSVAWFLLAAPLASFSSPLVGVGRNKKRAGGFTALAVLAVSPVVHIFSIPSLMAVAGALLLPVVVILIVDDALIRRGSIRLEELYVAPSHYGRLYGYGGAACMVTLLAWVALLNSSGLKSMLQPASEIRGDTVAEFAARAELAWVPILIFIVATSYLLLRMVELRLPILPRPGSTRVGAKHSPGSPDQSSDVTESRAALVDGAAGDEDEDEEWPEDADSRSEARWFDNLEEMSNPSVTELGDPHFVKKSDE